MNQHAQTQETPGEEEVATIMAAIAAYLDLSPQKVELRTVRETGPGPRFLWSLTSRQVQHAGRRGHASWRDRA